MGERVSTPANDPVYAANLSPASKAWVHRVWSLGYGHGSELVEEMGRETLAPPIDPNMLLECWERAGWIIRDAKPSPSEFQRWAGVGGRPPGKLGGGHSYPIEFGWSANWESDTLGNYILT